MRSNNRDAAAGARVVAGDDVVDDLRRRIEAHCIELIWRQQPVAGELREIAAMLEIATDLERVGDYAVDISKNAIKLSDQPMRPQRVEIDRIASVAHAMLLDAMRAYTERDARLASEVIDRDDEVDKLYKRSIKLLQEEMRADPEIVRPGTRYLFVLASLERVGDRAGNIAWHTKDMIGARVSTPLPRSEFAVTRRYVYLNHASAGVLAALVGRLRSRAFVREHAEAGVLGTFPYDAAMPEYREKIGRFIGASGDEIAIDANTSAARARIALGLDWRRATKCCSAITSFPPTRSRGLRCAGAASRVRLLATRASG